MAFKFRGGIHPNDNKNATNQKAIEKVKAPEFVCLPMSMHIGAPCSPIVKKGDLVKIGQKIADSDAALTAPVHATISGVVTEVGPKLAPTGILTETIVIKNDFKDEVYEELPKYDYENMSVDEMVLAIREAGIVGHGGAAFPTHFKIKSGLSKVDTIIINGAECEPYITSDHRVLLEDTERLVKSFKILEKIFGVDKIFIGIEENKKDTFPVVQKALEAEKSDAKLVKLHTRFPQGAEKQLIYAVTKREVPSGKLPADVGCVVFNVDTAICIYKLFTTGMPMVSRIVTIAGSAVGNPKNLRTPIGAPISHLIECAGGLKDEPNKLIMGGPMMGVSQFTTEVPVIKGTNAFLAFSGDEDIRVKNPSCLKCGKCVKVCPMGLVPVYMNMYASRDMFAEFEKIGGNDCIGCGSCSYECPARVDLVHNFKVMKEKIKKVNK